MADLSVEILGVQKLKRELRKLGHDGIPASFKGVYRSAAELVAEEAASKVPVRSGRLRNSIRAAGQAKQGVIRMGGAKVPYAGPIDFGGYPKGRPFKRLGRFLYPALEARRAAVIARMHDALDSALRKFQ